MQNRWRLSRDLFFDCIKQEILPTWGAGFCGAAAELVGWTARKAVLWFHWDYQAHMQNSSPPLTGSGLTVGHNTCTHPVWGERACSPGRKSSFYTVNVLSLTDRPSPSAGSPLQPLCNHGDKAVTLHLRQRVTSGPYCLIQSPGMTWIFFKSFNGVFNICCAVALLDSQIR